MEIIAIALLVVLVGASYQWGYSKREDRFQSNPIQFWTLDKRVLFVSKDGVKYVVDVLDDELVEIRKLTSPTNLRKI